MRKNLHYKVLTSVLAIAGLYFYNAPAAWAEITYEDNRIKGDGTAISIVDNKIVGQSTDLPTTCDVYGNYQETQNANGDGTTINVNIQNSTLREIFGALSSCGSTNNNFVNIDNSTASVIGGKATGKANTSNANGNKVTINNSTVSYVYGGYSFYGSANDNVVIIKDSTVKKDPNIYTFVSIIGGYATNYINLDKISATGNTVKLIGNTIVENADIYGGRTVNSSSHNIDVTTGNKLILENWSGEVGSINNFENIDFENIDITKGSVLTVKGTTNFSGIININSITVNEDTLAGDYAQKDGVILSNISWSAGLGNNVTVHSNVLDALNGIPLDDYYSADNTDNGIYVNKFSKIDYNTDTAYQVNFTADVDKSILTGKFIDENGNTQCNSNQTPDTASLTIGDGFTTNVGTVAGVYAADSNNATDGKLIISGNTTYGKNLYGAYAENGNAENSTVEISGNTNYNGTVYAGYSESGAVNNNTITVASGTKAEKMSLSGSNKTTAAGTLSINGNGSELNNISNFETINFNKVALNEAAAINVQEANLTGTTTINVNSFADGQIYHGGESVTLLKSAKAITGAGNVTIANDIVTAGLIQDLHISTARSADNTSIDLYVKDVSMNDQINLVAENRAVAAAFVNQGTDLIADSLDTISRDSNYGVKTFAAVHGNRSKYDVNSDIKINGWSVIAGVGNAGKLDNGSEFSWGVFYENGSGNYRTFNEFNNEFFRGDGSLVYNGGGIAARYTNKNGVYTEGSLRAGMLKSDMDNALRDGADNFYGYETESAYYGAHIGIGKIISLSESSDLDVYGKFFHTYTEGDSFKVAGDEFEFDSINSDRLRIGARITSNKENKFSTYYGLAYEYEFNGNADMTAQGLKAPTQSLQGSSVMAEVGFNYQPTPDSPWSFDLNMRGYTGERQGGSFNVQATYTF